MKEVTLRQRISKGWPIKKAIFLPVDLGNKYKLHKALPHGRVE